MDKTIQFKHGGKAHQILMQRLATEYKTKGYQITIAGQRNKTPKYRGFPKVDIIAEKNNEIVLIECGWLSSLDKLKTLKSEKQTLPYLKDKKLKIVWCPKLRAMEQQKSALV